MSDTTPNLDSSPPSAPSNAIVAEGEERAPSEVRSFEDQYQEEVSPGLDRMELSIAAFGLVTTLASVAFVDLALSVGWACGWLVGQVNVAFLRRMMFRVIKGGVGGKVGIAALVFKMLALLGVVWALLTWLPASPLGFAGGFTATIAGLVFGSVIVAHRHLRGDSGGDAGFTQPSPETSLPDDPDSQTDEPAANRHLWSPA